MKIKPLVLTILLSISLLGCMHSVGYVKVKPDIDPVRINFPTELNIVLTDNVKDKQTAIGKHNDIQRCTWTDFRQSLGEAVGAGFSPHFRKVNIVAQETDKGAYLVISKAAFSIDSEGLILDSRARLVLNDREYYRVKMRTIGKGFWKEATQIALTKMVEKLYNMVLMGKKARPFIDALIKSAKK